MTEERATYRAGPTGPIRDTALLPYSDPAYTEPTTDEIRAALSIAGLSGNQAAQVLGVSSGRTVRKWTGGEQAMPYSAWRLLLEKAGLLDDAGAHHGSTLLDGMPLDWWARWIPFKACWRIVAELVDTKQDRVGTAAMTRYGFGPDLAPEELEAQAVSMCRDQLLHSRGATWQPLSNDALS